MATKSPIATSPEAGVAPTGSIEPFPEKKESTLKQDDTVPSNPSSRWRSLFQHDVDSSDWDILILSTCLKVLLFPA